MTATTTGDLTFGSINSIGNVTTSANTTTFSSSVNAAKLDVTSVIDTKLNGNVTTTDTQTYKGAVTLTNPVQASTTNSAIAFNSTVDGNQNLTVNTGTGNIDFSGAVGGKTALGNLTANSTGTTRFNSTVNATSLTTDTGGKTELNGNVTTTGTQTYNDAVSLTGNTDRTLLSSSSSIAFFDNLQANAINLTLRGKEIDFNSLVSGTGNLIFENADPNQAIALGGLTNNANSLTLTTKDLNAISNQNLINNRFASVTIGSTTSTANVNIDTSGASFNTPNVTIQAGAITINGNISNAGNLNLRSPQTKLGGDLNTSSGNGNILVTGAISLQGTARNVNAGAGNITFNQNVTGETNLTANATQINLGGNVNTLNSDQVYNALVSLGNDLTFTGNNLSFNNKLDANTRSLTVNAQNAISSQAIESQGKNISLSSSNSNIQTGTIITGASNVIKGGDLTVSTKQNSVTTLAINTSGTQQGGNVKIENTENGGLPIVSISTGNIATNGSLQGGNVTLIAGNRITTGAIATNSTSGNGGSVDLVSPNLIVSSINTNGGISGGSVNVNFASNNAFLGKFLVNGSFTDIRGIPSSISTAASISGDGGAINIKLLGNNVPFTVGGQASISSSNGTVENITSGSVTVPRATYFYNFSNGNTQIITGNGNNPGDDFKFIKIPNINANNTDDKSNDVESKTQEITRILDVAPVREKSAQEIQNILKNRNQESGTKSAVVYINFKKPQGKRFVDTSPYLDTIEILVRSENGDVPLKEVKVDRAKFDETTKTYYTAIQNGENQDYKKYAQAIYSILIKPIEKVLEEEKITNLLFSLDSRLVKIPLSSLYDGQKHLIEKYSIALIPTFSLLNDNPYIPLHNSQVLAMGISDFSSSLNYVDSPLKAVPTELRIVTNNGSRGQSFLNEKFTLDNFLAQRQVDLNALKKNGKQFFDVVHFATHAYFDPKDVNKSAIQLWQKEEVGIREISKLRLNNPSISLLVFSACKTALGTTSETDISFAGLSVKSGASTVVASIWSANDQDTVGLMSEFYRQIFKTDQKILKSEALRRAQLSMLRGEIKFINGKLTTLSGIYDLPLEEKDEAASNFSHPSSWATFVTIGSPW